METSSTIWTTAGNGLRLHVKTHSVKVRRNTVRATGLDGSKFIVPLSQVLYIEHPVVK